MATFAVLGSTGYTGRIVAEVAVARGHEVVLVARDAGRVRALAAGLGDGVRDVRTVDATDPAAVAAAVAGCDLVLSAVGGDLDTVAAVRAGAVAAGLPLVDTAADPRGLRRAHAELDDVAREARLAIVPGVGWRTLPGDLLADVAATRVDRPRTVHAAYVVPGAGGLLGAASRGERTDLAAQLGLTGFALDHAMPVEELPGEVRRLAWFPRPIGPHHAAGIPGAEALTVPAHVPGVRTVRTYLAVSSIRAELLQGVANLSRWSWARDRVTARLTRGAPGSGPPEARRRATRWACVVEVEGEDTIARGWANGLDPHATTARCLAVVAESVLADRGASGVIAPALAGVPGDLLDELAASSELRWSVGRVDGRS